ncbi:MAG TPA: CBS domain-containing protein [Longimicrobiales bacterium]
MKVRELLQNKPGRVITVHPREQVATVIELLMRHGIGGVPVVTLDNEVVGFVAERDIVKALHTQEAAVRQLTVERVMRRPAPLCRVDDTLNDVMAEMTLHRLRHMVVLDGDRIAGIISLGDIVKQRLEQAQIEAEVLRDMVAAQRVR